MRLRLLVPLALLAFSSFASAEVVQSKYYDLQINGSDGEEFGRMLDQLYGQLYDYFGKGPQERLKLVMSDNVDEYHKALKDDGQPEFQSGGYYSPGTKKAYLYRQPSIYYTRQLLLHEATHQFHFLAITNNRRPSSGWYTEGIAEYFGMHNWDGKTLKTGVVPAISLEDYPSKALTELEEKKWDMEAIGTGKVRVARPSAWALVSYLQRSHAPAFKTLREQLDRRVDPEKAWNEAFAGSAQRISDGAKDWVKSNQQPWQDIWMGWQQQGEKITGTAQAVAIAVLKDTPKLLDVQFSVAKGASKAGVVFGFKSVEDFYVAQIWDGEQVYVFHRTAGKWETVLRARSAKKGLDSIQLDLSVKDSVKLNIGGSELKSFGVAGQVGLSLDGSTVQFSIAKK